MDDKLLIDKIHSGSSDAFEHVFMVYYQPLSVFACKLVGDLDLAKDIVQDVLVHFFEKHNKLNIHTSLKAHLYQSVKNKCLNHLKREKIIRTHHSSIFIEKKKQEEVFIDLMEETELENHLNKAIQTLPNQCQRIFEMSRFQGKSNQEIADELSISKRTVETQISNALKKLKVKLMPYLKILILVFHIFI